MGLTGRVLTLTGGENLTKDGFADLALVDACALDKGFQNGRAKIVCRCIREASAKTADRRARC